MILSTHGIVSSISGIDADWLAYYNRVIAAGGSLSTTEQSATLQLVLDLKANSLWTPMKAIYPMVGASAAACAQNLKSASFTGTFTSGWTFASTGVTGNGTSDYMNTGLNLSTQTTLYNVAYSMYIRNNTNSKIDMGVTDSVTGYTKEGWMAARYGEIAYGGFYNNASTNGGIEASNSDSIGFWQNSMIASNNIFFRRNSTNIGTFTGTNTSIPANATIYLGACNNVGSAIEYSNHEYAFCTISDGLTSTQAGNFYTAVQAFQTTLSRNV
jgi:hypothetical protein